MTLPLAKVFVLTIMFQVPFSAMALKNFNEAKKFLTHNLELFDSKTIYCGCPVNGRIVDVRACGYKIHKDPRRASRLEWEHVVPAENFGRSFIEWREGGPKCHKKGKPFRGRKCAATNPEFAQIEGDLYNLFPEIGELNGLRSNYSMAAIPGEATRFGACAVKLEGRKFEPMDQAKGIVARTYIHMDRKYPGRGIVSEKNEALFAVWNHEYPITPLECERWKAIEKKQKDRHYFADRCPK
ncbi:MAG: endonuclease [Bdellovibrionota bacterium]